MKNWVKKQIRSLYWKYAHDGDPWQARLIVYHLGRIIETAPGAASGKLILAQIEAAANKPLGSPFTAKFNMIADLEIEDIDANRGLHVKG